MVILGIEKVNYVSKKTGRAVLGTQLYYSEKDGKVHGAKTGSVYVSASSSCYDVIASLDLNDNIAIYYDKYGRIASVVKIDE